MKKVEPKKAPQKKEKWIPKQIFIPDLKDPVYQAKILDCKWNKQIIGEIINVIKWTDKTYLAVDFQNGKPHENFIIMNEDLEIL